MEHGETEKFFQTGSAGQGRRKRPLTVEENRHSIIIRTDQPALLRKEIICWGEAEWWPKGSLMAFRRLSSGEVALGTLYMQKVLLPLAPRWRVEVSEVTNRSISRRFLDGMFKGCEQVSFQRAAGGWRVEYVMHYEVRGFLNRFLWFLVFRRLHDRNIKEILGNLKIFMETQ